MVELQEGYQQLNVGFYQCAPPPSAGAVLGNIFSLQGFLGRISDILAAEGLSLLFFQPGHPKRRGEINTAVRRHLSTIGQNRVGGAHCLGNIHIPRRPSFLG